MSVRECAAECEKREQQSVGTPESERVVGWLLVYGRCVVILEGRRECR